MLDNARNCYLRIKDALTPAGQTKPLALQRHGTPCCNHRRIQRYLGTQARLEIDDCTAIVIDDGIATGATTRAALRATRTRNPKKLVLAVPLAPTSVLDELRDQADDIVCLEDYEFFGAIGTYYRDFSQVSDEQVIDILKQFSRRLNQTKEPAA